MGIQLNGITGDAIIPGDVGIGGTLTYEDVANVDSIGIITARTDVLVGSTIKLGASSGIITATSFVGSGANLTNLPAANLTGTLPAISGANLTGISGVSVANQSDNRLITATGTTDALNAESGAVITSDSELIVGMTAGGGASPDARLQVRGDTFAKAQIQVLSTHNDDNPASLQISKSRGSGNTILGDNDDIGQINFAGNDGNGFHNVGRIMVSSSGAGNGNDDLPAMMRFFTTANGGVSLTERLRITDDGQVKARTLSGNFHVISSTKDGSTSARAATSAWEIKKTLGAQARTGYYYLKNPYDDTVSQWWCDMDTDGGGWILIAHVGDGAMSALSTADGNHWWNRSHKGGFDTVGSGYYKGGGYWRKPSDGSWAENTCGQLMWDVRTHGVQNDNYSVSKVVFNWGTDQSLPTGSSGYGNIPNNTNRRFNEWCYEVVGAPGFDPANYHQNQRGNVISGANNFTEHMVMTWSFRNTSGGGDAGADGPYWMIGAHHDGLHQHYEESLSGSDGDYGDGGYQVVSNEDTGWGGGGSNGGYDRRSKFVDNLGTCNIWLR